MIYLSAQPDDLYFLWQLELQIYNFSALGIPKEQIHVLVGYDPKKGLHPFFQRFRQENHRATVFAYADNRKQNKYLSSIRPYLIAAHLKQHPELESETLFYHDSDIIFRCLPDWDLLTKGPAWYVSDTRTYLDTRYILSQTTENVFRKMCEIVGIAPERVKEADADAGGAQYVFKSCTAGFWEKVERDCEEMYAYLYAEAQRQGRYNPLKDGGLQLWCTDMWVVWWNALLENREMRIHPLLDFCWANDPLDRWDATCILHYTGNSKRDKKAFDKSKYTHVSPFYADLSEIDPGTCSIRLAEEIRRYKENLLDARRPRLEDATLVYVQPSAGEPFSPCLRRLALRYLDMAVCYTTETTWKADGRALATPYCFVCRDAWLCTPEVLLRMLEEVRRHPSAEIHFHYPAFRLDPLGRQIFSFLLEEGYLSENRGKMRAEEKPLEIVAYASPVQEREAQHLYMDEPVYIF